MKKSLQRQILRFSIASIFGLVLAVVTHFAAAQNLTIQVNSQTDKPLALEAQVCDTDLSDQEQTCSFRAALELVEVLGSSAEAKFETFQIDFNQLDTTTSIQISSPLPKINYPVIIDGSGSNCSNPDLAYTPKV
jgi:hypothetical protein